jgi:hypothetical protein
MGLVRAHWVGTKEAWASSSIDVFCGDGADEARRRYVRASFSEQGLINLRFAGRFSSIDHSFFCAGLTMLIDQALDSVFEISLVELAFFEILLDREDVFGNLYVCRPGLRCRESQSSQEQADEATLPSGLEQVVRI